MYGNGAAYLSNDPRACISCHVMQGHFDSWQSSGHRHVAVCNDCHLPPGFALPIEPVHGVTPEDAAPLPP